MLLEAAVNIARLAAVITGRPELPLCRVYTHIGTIESPGSCLALNGWLPVSDEFRYLLVSEEGAILAKQTIHFDLSLEWLERKRVNPLLLFQKPWKR